MGTLSKKKEKGVLPYKKALKLSHKERTSDKIASLMKIFKQSTNPKIKKQGKYSYVKFTYIDRNPSIT